MARQTTCDTVVKIRQLLGGDIPATNRLSKLDSDIWRLGLIINNKPKLNIEAIKKNRIFSFCQATNSEISIELDKGVLKKIIGFYEEEYNKQLDICNDIIRKLESTDKDI